MKNWISKQCTDPVLYSPGNLLGPVWDNLFESFFKDAFYVSDLEAQVVPALDVYEEKDRIVVKTDLPGMDKKAIKVKVQDNILTISGEKKSENKDKREGYYREERAFGSFQRSLRLKPGLKTEGVEASYKDGVLTINIPKSADKIAESRDIDVK